MGQKRKADELEQDNSELYEIEFIYAARRVAGKTDLETGWEFLVKWFNYPIEEISWEPYSHLKSNNELLKSFWKDTGFPNKSPYPPGFMIYASSKFIERWKNNAERANKEEDTTSSKTDIEEESDSDDDKPLTEVLKLKIKIPSRHSIPQATHSSMDSNSSSSVQTRENGTDSVENVVVQSPSPIIQDRTLTPTDNQPTEDMFPSFEDSLTITSADPIDLTSKVFNDSPLHLTHRTLQDNLLSPMLQSHLSLPYAGDQPTEFEVEISKLFSEDGISPAISEVSGNTSAEFHSVQPNHSQSRSEFPVKPRPSMKVNDRFEGMLFPHWLHDYMKDGERPYCIWMDNSSSPQTECETERLRLILKLYKNAVDVGHIPDVKIVFIHVGSLPTIQLLSSLTNRLNAFTTMFTLFGTDPGLPPLFQWEFREIFPIDPDVPPFQWPGGFREIFPIGGIVTFTAGALLEDPAGIYLHITQIAEHPLWASYIIPSVFGMAVKTLYRDKDPLEAFDCGTFVYQDFLTAIDDGAMSLIRAPSSLQDSEWFHDQVVSQFRSCRETLEFCLQEFTSKYADVAESEYAPRLASEMVEDFTAMRIQPSIMKDYRRFVILKQSHDATPADHHSFEWLHSSCFDVSDRFFEWKN